MEIRLEILELLHAYKQTGGQKDPAILTVLPQGTESTGKGKLVARTRCTRALFLVLTDTKTNRLNGQKTTLRNSKSFSVKISPPSK
jgi:hypothetical protein